jgi:hypothetical protein
MIRASFRVSMSRIPDTYVIAIISANQKSSISAKTNTFHWRLMRAEREDLTKGRHVPQPYAPIVATRNESTPIWRSVDAVHSICMSEQSPALYARIYVPELDRAISVSSSD